MARCTGVCKMRVWAFLSRKGQDMDWLREDRRPFRTGEPLTVLFSNKGSYGGTIKTGFGG